MPARLPERLRTERLLLERPSMAAHAEGLALVLAEPAVARWLWPGALGGPRTAEQTAALVAGDAAAWEHDGFGPWVVRDGASGEILGRAGLARTTLDDEPRIELAWLITSRRWGQGLATEAARPALAGALEDLALDEVVALTLVDNHASQGVMRRLGMREVRRLLHAGLPHVLYAAAAPSGR